MRTVKKEDGTVDGNQTLTSRQLATAILKDEVDLGEKGVNKDLQGIMDLVSSEGPVVIHFKEH